MMLRQAQQNDYIDYEGFGLSQGLELDDVDGIAGDKAQKQNRKTEKLRKEFAKLLNGKDQNIMMEPRKTRS